MGDRRSLHSSKVLSSLSAGAVAGAIAKTTIAPLDRTKINFQVTSQRYSFCKAVKFLATSYRKDGMLMLWRGNSATMARVIPYAALQFMSHEQYKVLLRPHGVISHGALPPFRRLLAGSLAGLTATVITYPLDMARARMAVTDRHTYRGLYDVIWSTLKAGGSLYRGITPTVLGIIPYAGISFFTYETLKQAHHDLYNSEPNPVIRLCFGAFAGLLGQNASYPLDIVRRRMQTEGLVLSHVSYKTIVRTLKYVLKTEGLRGLYKGVSMNWIKGPVAVSVSFNVYDHMLKFLQQFRVFSDTE